VHLSPQLQQETNRVVAVWADPGKNVDHVLEITKNSKQDRGHGSSGRVPAKRMRPQVQPPVPPKRKRKVFKGWSKFL
jgi:hypothetical protein